MTPRFYDLLIGGVMLAPILSYGAVSLIVALVLHPILRRIGSSTWFLSPSIAEFSLYMAIFSLITLLA
ncbi:hypothetical protein ASD99_29435 [Mesorhizobium sp. Root695]|uniref:DUF1656 domain-containing protein n=1 Tax=Mesorhizobium sp. Root695 TaxID=1736589 RepID=UPI00070D3009|nr:DUF1656 domain-containing protein [Mesorhizobium sp. Root695]KRB24075.1 hypothetical protein ASD99_29435 [Mesorhizobium sp. Root695]